MMSVVNFYKRIPKSVFLKRVSLKFQEPQEPFSSSLTLLAPETTNLLQSLLQTVHALSVTTCLSSHALLVRPQSLQTDLLFHRPKKKKKISNYQARKENLLLRGPNSLSRLDVFELDRFPLKSATSPSPPAFHLPAPFAQSPENMLFEELQYLGLVIPFSLLSSRSLSLSVLLSLLFSWCWCVSPSVF